VQADPTEYRQLDLKAHAFLAEIELHDVWLIELEGGGPDRTIEDVRRCFTPQTATSANASVQTLFAIRRWVGRAFGWDSDEDRWERELYCHRLTDEERERSLVPPGSEDGLFRIVYVYTNEALSEVRNATVHAFSCLALRRTMSGYRLYWAIYVKPIGRWTGTYMRVIDPFRRAVVYPAIINRVRTSWATMFGG
jgi:hypothetical protein